MKKFYLLLTLAVLGGAAAGAQEASYDHPIGLRYIGTIDDPDPQPVCSFTTRNPINEGAFLWAPAGSTVKYRDTSSGAPRSWMWETTGGELASPTSQDALITYKAPGTYDFPRLTVGYEGGNSVAAPAYKLKVGGVAELCHADTREWTQTYALGVNMYDQANGAERGSLGGTNSLGIIGVGNLYMLSVEEGFLDGVNVYFHHKPTRYKEGAKIGVRVWMANIGETDVQLASIPIEGDVIPFENFKGTEDGAWVPVSGGAVAQMKCSSPVDLFGKPFIFIDVYGWSNDPATEDLQMLMDVMPNVQMQPEHAQNLLAHNSFVRLEAEDDYLRPVSYFGGNYGSFMICPVVRGGETPLVSVAVTEADADSRIGCVVEGGSVRLTGADGGFSVFNLSGSLCISGEISGGSAEFDGSALAPGVYIVSTAAGQSAKFVKI